MAEATATGTVKLEGNSKGLVISYKTADEAAKTLTASLFKQGQAWDSANAAAKRAQHELFITSARMENARERAAALDKTFGKAGQQSVVAANGISRFGSAAKHGTGPTKALGSAIHNVSAGQSSLSQAVNQVLSSFGPWGMVIGAAATGLVHLAMKQGEAEKAARKATAEIRQQVGALKDLGKEARLQELNKAQAEALETGFFGASTEEAEVAKEKAKAIRREIARLEDSESRRKRLAMGEAGFAADNERKAAEEKARQDEKLHEYDKQIAVAKSMQFSAKEVHALELQRMRTQADFLSGEEKAAMLREIEVKELTGVVETEKKRTKEKKEQFKNVLAHAAAVRADQERVGAMQHRAKFGEFDAAIADMQASGLRRGDGKAEQIAGATRATGGRLNEIEQERAAEKDFNLAAELDRIEQEKAALLSLADLKWQLATTGGERDAIDEERKQIRHQAEMQRIEAEKQAEEEREKRIKTGLDLGKKAATSVVTGLVSVSEARRDAIRLARMQGKTEAEAARLGKIAELETRAAQMKGIRDMAILKSIDHAFEAVGAFARYDFASGALHLAASAGFAGLAGVTGARSRGLSDRAANMEGSAANGFGGAQGGTGSPGGTGGGPQSRPGSDSEIPGSPTPKPKGFWEQSKPAQTVINIDRVYGTVDKEFAKEITEAQVEYGYSSPGAKRTG